jgi:excisionase family DNA binding protein
MKQPPKRTYTKREYPNLTELELPARLWSINQAAERLGISPWTIRDYITQGKLTAYRVGPRLLRLDGDEVEALGRRA